MFMFWGYLCQGLDVAYVVICPYLSVCCRLNKIQSPFLLVDLKLVIPLSISRIPKILSKIPMTVLKNHKQIPK